VTQVNEAKLSPRKNEFSRAWEYELLEDFRVEFQGEIIVVPKYFSYDGASIPSIGWQAIYTPFDPIVMVPALVHDWVYSNHQLVDRGLADTLLKRLLKNNGVPQYKVVTIHRAVNFFGGAAWENTPDDLKYLRWLKKKLTDNGVDVEPYRFPDEV
jgi:hypothetical protein